MTVTHPKIKQQYYTLPQMHGHKPHSHSQSHSCQIDCTNHDEVINSLQSKSKDLYYFWRNYQWLYNKYYSQEKNAGKKQQDITVQLQELEEEKERYVVENRKLRMEVELLRKQLEVATAGNNSKKIEEEYQKEIARLNTKCQQYQKIRQKHSQQISTLTSTLRQKDHTISDLESKSKQSLKKQQQRLLQLQTINDNLRQKLLNSGTGGTERIVEIQQKMRRETSRMQGLVKNLEEKCWGVVQGGYEEVRREMLERFSEVFGKFAQGDLSGIVVEEYEEYEEH